MNREENKYKNVISDEILNATEMLEYIKSEAKRQYMSNNHYGCSFEDCTIDEQQEMILNQFANQLSGDWIKFNEDKNEDRELKVHLDIYVSMYNDETEEDAENRLREKLDCIGWGISYQIYETEIQLI